MKIDILKFYRLITRKNSLKTAKKKMKKRPYIHIDSSFKRYEVGCKRIVI